MTYIMTIHSQRRLRRLRSSFFDLCREVLATEVHKHQTIARAEAAEDRGQE